MLGTSNIYIYMLVRNSVDLSNPQSLGVVYHFVWDGTEGEFDVKYLLLWCSYYRWGIAIGG